MEFYRGYVKMQGETFQGKVFEDQKLTYEKHESLKADGWLLVLDNKYKDEAAVYDALNDGVMLDDGTIVSAFRYQCRRCHWYLPTEEVRKLKYVDDDGKERSITGRICAHCEDYLQPKN